MYDVWYVYGMCMVCGVWCMYACYHDVHVQQRQHWGMICEKNAYYNSLFDIASLLIGATQKRRLPIVIS
jgi:hypothetical protein